jgi:hypothetical protein
VREPRRVRARAAGCLAPASPPAHPINAYTVNHSAPGSAAWSAKTFTARSAAQSAKTSATFVRYADFTDAIAGGGGAQAHAHAARLVRRRARTRSPLSCKCRLARRVFQSHSESQELITHTHTHTPTLARPPPPLSPPPNPVPRALKTAPPLAAHPLRPSPRRPPARARRVSPLPLRRLPLHVVRVVRRRARAAAARGVGVEPRRGDGHDPRARGALQVRRDGHGVSRRRRAARRHVCVALRVQLPGAEGGGEGRGKGRVRAGRRRGLEGGTGYGDARRLPAARWRCAPPPPYPQPRAAAPTLRRRCAPTWTFCASFSWA